MEGPETEQLQLKKMEVIILEEQQEQEGMAKECKEEELFEEGHKRGRDVHIKKHEEKKNDECIKEHEEKKKDIEMEKPWNSDEDVRSDSYEMFVDDLDSEQASTSDNDDESNSEVPLTDAEVEELIAEFLEVESKAAEAQESLEKESLARVESEVRAELAENLHGDALEMAISTEMKTFREEWEAVLDDLETRSALLSEQLDGAGIELSSLYKYIESQVPNGCCTEAWKKRAHWVGSQVTNEVNQSIREAEEYLQSCRPVRRRHGRLLEEGASGFLERTLSIKDKDNLAVNSEKDWSKFDELIQSHGCSGSTSFGSKNWASVYLASTPQQAAELGLKLPGVDEVEEIGEIEGNINDPLYAAAIANEKEIELSEEQRRKYRKVREEDDVQITMKLQRHLKRRRNKNIQESIEKDVPDGSSLSNECPQPVSEKPSLSENSVANVDGTDIFIQNLESQAVISNGSKNEKLMFNGTWKRSHENEDAAIDNKRSRTVIIDSDDEVQELDSKSVSHAPSREQDSPSHVRKEVDIIDVDVLPSPCPKDISRNFRCTACSDVLKASEVHRHPLLDVIICGNCKFLVVEKRRLEDPVLGGYCRWCGKGDDVINCNSCKILFCAACIARNFGEECLSEAKTSGWQCCCCSPTLLHGFILDCEKAIGGLVVFSSDSDSDSELSGGQMDVTISNRKRQKRKIRRILDDAELGEETKQKIAMEKARQEHLKSMQAQSAGKLCHKSPAYVNGDATEVAMGVADDGYIVNVAREEDEEPVRIPRSISAKLKPHQVAGIRFMWENVIQSVKKVRSGDRGFGCILAHTMGLGKTFQVIAFLYAAMRTSDLELKTALIVTPVNVLHNWRQEFVKWKPEEGKPLRVYMLEDVTREKRAYLLSKWRIKGGVLLIGYAAFRNLSLGKHVKDRHAASEICNALHYGPDILVCDEAHMIKNTRADITQALKQVKTQRRIALTGSPLQNNLMEYYCMVDFVREGYLGSSHEFRNRFQNPIENGQHTNSTLNDVKIMNQRSHILYEQLKGFVQRMDMNVVKKDLPPKTVFVITVKLSPLQRKLYKKFLDVHGFTSDKVSSEKTIRRSCFFAGYQALAQIWNHPGLLQMAKEHRDSLRREDAVENFLVDDSSSDDNMETDLTNGEKQRMKNGSLHKKSDTIFCHEENDWWEDLLNEKIYREVDYSGKMVLLLDILSMSSEAGDKALVFSQSLTTLDLIELFLSKLPRKGREGKYWKQGKDWYRYGQNKPVYAYRLMAHGTMEEKIYKRQVTKEGLAARVVDRQQIHRTMSKEEILHLFDFGEDENSDMLEQKQENQVLPNQYKTGEIGYSWGQKSLPLSHGACCTDKIMESIFSRHYPRWIANYHEHETLLQENEAERLSKEEQDIAWQTYQRSLEWEEVHRTVFEDSERKLVADDHVKKKLVADDALPESSVPRQTKGSSRSRPINQRKCTNLAHLLTLRSQGTKSGCSTICGECAQEISWENLNRDGRSR
uniref:Protein CHROMATIN REMODELING 20 isoform X2 n=1 Tax=Elaeis guineensis var. tenera TaxID=51953 RepID=A0A8N4I8C0_ELAGV|nr:protein CHROMATIN REMODELING 20 isoform X2 [Elaeis guineensis]